MGLKNKTIDQLEKQQITLNMIKLTALTFLNDLPANDNMLSKLKGDLKHIIDAVSGRISLRDYNRKKELKLFELTTERKVNENIITESTNELEKCKQACERYKALEEQMQSFENIYYEADEFLKKLLEYNSGIRSALGAIKNETQVRRDKYGDIIKMGGDSFYKELENTTASNALILAVMKDKLEKFRQEYEQINREVNRLAGHFLSAADNKQKLDTPPRTSSFENLLQGQPQTGELQLVDELQGNRQLQRVHNPRTAVSDTSYSDAPNPQPVSIRNREGRGVHQSNRPGQSTKI